MAKSILMSIQPKYAAKILNGEKTIEVRKKFPKDYVGWVYIYCTKDNKEGLHIVKDKWVCIKHNKVLKECCYNGTVVARFWCNKVEEIHCGIHYEPEVDIGIAVLPAFTCVEYSTETLGHFDLLKKVCLADYTLPYLPHDDELNHCLNGKKGYAIYISNLETFDKPKELKKFKVYDKTYDNVGMWGWAFSEEEKYCPLKRTPQNWCYIEGE